MLFNYLAKEQACEKSSFKKIFNNLIFTLL